MIPYLTARDWTVARPSRVAHLAHVLDGVAHVLDRTGASTAMNVLKLRVTVGGSLRSASRARGGEQSRPYSMKALVKGPNVCVTSIRSATCANTADCFPRRRTSARRATGHPVTLPP